MDEIKDFFKKLKVDHKFKKAGEGHSLTAGMGQQEAKIREASTPRSSSGAPSSSSRSSEQRVAQLQPAQAQSHSQTDDSRQRAAAAALSRYGNLQSQQQRSSQLGTFRFAERTPSTGARASDQAITSASSGQVASTAIARNAQTTAVANVGTITQIYYNCPALKLSRMPRFELEDCIRASLYEMRAQEPLLASILILKTCNRFNKAITAERIERAAQILAKYIGNLVEHPSDVKFRQIRAENRVFRESVLSIEGSVGFLSAIGFISKRLPKSEGAAAATPRNAADATTNLASDANAGAEEEMEDFFVFEDELDSARIAQLTDARDLLLETAAMDVQIDRDVRVLRMSGATSPRDLHVEFPPEFFSLSKDDAQSAQRALEQASVDAQGLRLRGKAAQERQDAAHKTRLRENYPFTLLRIRFPNDLLVQGVFESSEPLASALDWLASLLVVDWCPYELRNPLLNIAFSSEQLDDAERSKSLLDLELAPTMLLNFCWSKTLLDDISKQMALNPSQQPDSENLVTILNRYLKPECLEAVSRG